MESRIRLATANGFRGSTFTTALVCVLLAAIVGVITVKLGSVQHQLKALLIVAAGFAIVVAALRPVVGLALLLALMPFEFHFSGTGTNEVLVAAMAVVLAWRIKARVIPVWASIGGLALVFGGFLATLGAQNHTVAFWGTVRWLGAVILMFVAVGVLRDRADASRRMVDLFTASAVVVVVFAFVQKLGLHLLVGAPYSAGHPNSFFGFYTVYAGYVAMAATHATGEVLIALGERRRGRASLYGAALVFILMGIAISTSRGGLVALGAGWLLLLLLNLRRGSVLLRGMLVLALVSGAALLATPRSTLLTIQDRLTVKSRLAGEDKTRFALQQAGVQALGQRPLGLGYGNFSYYLQGHAHSAFIQMAFDHAHETPIEIGLDAGWIGLIGFLTLWAWPLGLVLSHPGRGSSAVRASAFAAALGGVMAQGLFDYLFYEIDVLIFFVALVWGAIHSLSVAGAELEGSPIRRASPRGRQVRVLAAGL